MFVTLLQWLFANQLSLPDGIYKSDRFGNIYCSGMMLKGSVKPTSNQYLKLIKGLRSYDF